MKNANVTEVLDTTQVRDSLKQLRVEVRMLRDKLGWATEDGVLLQEWNVELRRLISFFV